MNERTKLAGHLTDVILARLRETPGEWVTYADAAAWAKAEYERGFDAGQQGKDEAAPGWTVDLHDLANGRLQAHHTEEVEAEVKIILER